VSLHACGRELHVDDTAQVNEHAAKVDSLNLSIFSWPLLAEWRCWHHGTYVKSDRDCDAMLYSCRHWCTFSIWCGYWHPASEDAGIGVRLYIRVCVWL